MKAIHGGKTKNDKIDSYKLATLLKGGNFPTAAKVALTPMAGRLRLAGTLELAGFDLSINRRRVQAIIQAVPAYLPQLDCESLELVEIRRGLRPCSPDGLPYLGRPAGYDNLIVATGHGTLGISLAPITSKIVFLLAAGKKPPLEISALGLERFH